jgi:hypothetical protein
VSIKEVGRAQRSATQPDRLGDYQTQHSGIARRREIRQDADFTQPYLPIRQMSQAVSDCRACGSAKELPSIQEIASASIDYVVGRIAIKINSYSLF